MQIVSATVDRVRQLSLFQRTPQWIMPQENPAYGEVEKAAFPEDPESTGRRRAVTGRRPPDRPPYLVFSSPPPAASSLWQACVKTCYKHE